MPANGQISSPPLGKRRVPDMQTLPRPVFARAESLPMQVGTPRHSHPWVQLSYAIQGVLHVHTDAGSFVAPPQRAIWIPAGLEHEVISSPHTELRGLYLDCAATDWAPGHCRVLNVSPLTRELISRFSALPVEYDEAGADGRLVQVMLDQLRSAEEVHLSLPLPTDPRLQQLCRRLQAHPEDGRSLSEWSGQLGASEKTLSRLFLRDTGLTFRAWRQRLRLLGALSPLEQGARVTDVALGCGYDSTSAFIAAFRQQFECTPGEFFRRV
ncbi:AraC family transcriptional regulator [Pseudomonas turukhanskensis]|nr:helix-turn-helix transcriptional regulator [Pseudomonas turukhanskensis]